MTASFSRVGKAQKLAEWGLAGRHPDMGPVFSLEATALLFGCTPEDIPETGGSAHIPKHLIQNGKRLLSETAARIGSDDITDLLYELAVSSGKFGA